MSFASAPVIAAPQPFRKRKAVSGVIIGQTMQAAILRVALAASAAAVAVAALAQATINVSTETGATINGTHDFVIRVSSEKLITQVEFYVDGDLHGTDSSSPYEFQIDTLEEKDGPLKVLISAYAEDGSKSEKSLNLTVDNGLSKGIDFHVEQGSEHLTESEWDKAILSGRRALKIESGSTDARLLLARAYFGKGVIDLAQKNIQDVLAKEPGNRAALELNAGISLDRAFSAVAREGARAETIAQISNALQTAATSRKASLDQQLDDFGDVTDANRWSYINLLSRAGRWSAIVEQLDGRFEDDPADSQVANWLIYSQIRAGRFRDATANLATYEKFGQPDAYGYALKAILYQYAGQVAESAAAERDAILEDATSLGVRSAQTYLAMRRGNGQAFAQLAQGLEQSRSASPIPNYYLSALQQYMRNYNASAERMKTALLADPALYDLYVERANQIIAYSLTPELGSQERDGQHELAEAFLNAALVVKPESFEALTGMSILFSVKEDWQEAIDWGRAAAKAGPEYAPAHYALANALYAGSQDPDVNERSSRVRNALAGEARQTLAVAERMDVANLRGRPIPKTLPAWQYFYRFGRVPLIALPTAQ